MSTKQWHLDLNVAVASQWEAMRGYERHLDRSVAACSISVHLLQTRGDAEDPKELLINFVDSYTVGTYDTIFFDTIYIALRMILICNVSTRQTLTSSRARSSI